MIGGFGMLPREYSKSHLCIVLNQNTSKMCRTSWLNTSLSYALINVNSATKQKLQHFEESWILDWEMKITSYHKKLTETLKGVG